MRTQYTTEELGARWAGTALVPAYMAPQNWRFKVLDAIWSDVVQDAIDNRRTLAFSQSAIDLHACHRLGWDSAELGL